MFALPRCVYAMAEDGLLFKTFAQISDNTQVPLNAVVVFGAATSIIALLFDIETLVEFLSIGTLLAYTIVSACVIVLRYRPTPIEEGIAEGSGGRIREWVPGQSWLSVPRPGVAVTWCVFTMIVGDAGVSVIFATGYARTMSGVLGSILFAFMSFAAFVLICLHYQNKAQISFKVPLVPLIPSISMLTNILLMMHLAPITWLRLVVWLVIGFAIYGFYGMKHSREEGASDSGALTKSTTYESVIGEST
uniref:AA_permease_C domain-containing protein n=1 Tax=Ascaris lumbricoides TaxID=6252 RepID=A0A0M3I2G4_ASCLU